MMQNTIIMIGPFPDDPLLIKGGVQASVCGLSLSLKEQDCDVKAISLPTKPGTLKTERTVESIPVSYLNAPYGFLASSAVYLPEIMRAINQAKSPIIHIHGTGLLQAILCLMLKFKSCHAIWTLHGITAKETWQRFRKKKSAGNFGRVLFYTLLEQICLRSAAEIIVDTTYVAQELVGTGRQFHVIPQGIFPKELQALQNAQREKPVILSLGVISPRKGHHLTLEAFARVRQEIPAAKLVIAGAFTDSAYFEHLRNCILKHGLSQHVDVHVNLPRSEILRLLNDARLLALHSQEESQGIALCEALAAGLPVVATQVGGIPHVVSDGQDGILTAYGDTTAFAAAIVKLLNDQELYTRMSRQAALNSQRFDWNAVAARILQIYESAGGGYYRADHDEVGRVLAPK